MSTLKPSSDPSTMQGKVCLVTGASAGIGKAAARGLASIGAQVVLAGRDAQATSRAVEEVKAGSGSQSVGYLLADFSDLRQVRQLVEAFKARYSRLDVLINNAGAYFVRRKDTSYGVEMTFLVNHLAPFLLTTLLLDLLQRSTPSRIVNVTSVSHQLSKANFDDLDFKRGSFGMSSYGRSKLANILFTYELARRLDGKGVTVNAVHPGFVDTNLWKRHLPLFGPVLQFLISRIALTPDQGADSLIYLAASPELAGVSGQYFSRRNPIPSSPLSYDRQIAQHLWEISARLTSQN